MKQFESFFYIAILGLVGLFGIYLQNSLIEEEVEPVDYNSRHDPDYYITNFTATGFSEDGKRRYVIEAERMVHFPDDDTAMMDDVHITEYDEGFAPRHTYADSGWMSSSGDEVLLKGNVKVVIEADARGPAITQKSKRLRILLDKDKKKNGQGG